MSGRAGAAAAARRADGEGMRRVTMATVRTFASALTIGVKCGPRSITQFSCSWPPRIRSISGTSSASSRSLARDRCVSATIASHLLLLQFGDRRARGLERRGVSHPWLLVRVDRQAEEADAERAAARLHRHDGVRSRSRERAPVRVGDVRRDDAGTSTRRGARAGRLRGCRTRGCRTWPSRPRATFSTATICRPARRSPLTRAVPSADGDT